MMDCRETTCWSQDYYDTDSDDNPHALPLSETEYEDAPGVEPLQAYCKEDPNPGFCYGTLEQWFYNATTAKCAPFRYCISSKSDILNNNIKVHWLCWQQEQLCLRV